MRQTTSTSHAGKNGQPDGLAHFIRANLDAIVDEFAEFARSHLPSAARLSPEELRDTSASLLQQIADDMDSEQSESERSGKSRGDSPENSPNLTDDAQAHASDRLGASFSLTEMVAEYRALRASVIRRWRAAGVRETAAALDDIVRFSEAIDQALTESIAWYESRTSRARELLVGMIAHDLRNPLGAVAMSAQYLVRCERLAPAELKAAGRILGSAQAMDKMVADLLDFAQLRMGGALSIQRSRTALDAVCADAVGELRAFHPARTIDLDVQADLHGQWDAARMRQIVSNLVGNALTHGAADTTVTVSAARAGDSVRLAVHNLGEPIPAANRDDIFDPLKRLPNSHASSVSGGIGLGLYIVKEIADAHGGAVSVASSREAGTTFTVELPVGGAKR